MAQATIHLESLSEANEIRLRAAAQVAAAIIKAPKDLNLWDACARKFGSKATGLFREQCSLSGSYRTDGTVQHTNGSATATVVYKADVVLKRVLVLEDSMPGSKWRCSCGLTESEGIPCRHIISHMLHVGAPAFAAFEPFFHERWQINTTLPQLMLTMICNKSLIDKVSRVDASGNDDNHDDDPDGHQRMDQNGGQGDGQDLDDPQSGPDDEG